MGEAGIGTQAYVGFQGLNGPAVAHQGAQRVLLAQVGGLNELAARRQAHRRRTLGHHGGVAGRHQGPIGNGILGVRPR